MADSKGDAKGKPDDGKYDSLFIGRSKTNKFKRMKSYMDLLEKMPNAQFTRFRNDPRGWAFAPAKSPLPANGVGLDEDKADIAIPPDADSNKGLPVNDHVADRAEDEEQQNRPQLAPLNIWKIR